MKKLLALLLYPLSTLIAAAVLMSTLYGAPLGFLLITRLTGYGLVAVTFWSLTLDVSSANVAAAALLSAYGIGMVYASHRLEHWYKKYLHSLNVSEIGN